MLKRFGMILTCVLAVGLAACHAEETAVEADASVDTATTAAPDVALPPAFEPANDTRSVAEKLDDARTAARVKIALVGQDSLRTADIEPVVVRGTVVLRGEVASARQRNTAADAARRVEGITGVVNQLIAPDAPIPADTTAMAVAPAVPEAAPPPKQPPAEKAAPTHHTVRSGDTLWDIARRNNTTVERIKQLNGSAANRLKPGQKIRVR